MSSSSLELLWVVVIGTGTLLALAIGFIATLINSHQRYKAAQREKIVALQESETRFRNLVENINEVYFVSDPAGKFLYGSPNLFSTSGYSQSELLGHSFGRLIAPHHRQRVVDYYRFHAAHGTVDAHIEFLARKKDGTQVWVEQTTRILRDAAGVVLSYQSVVRDVSERKRSEQLLAERENFLRTIIETEPECVNLLDHEGKLLSINKAGLEMIEADSLEQVLGKTIDQVVTEGYRKKFVELIRRVFEGQQGMLEYDIVGLRGAHRWLETHAVPLRNQEGIVTALLGITRDISVRKQAEGTLRRLAKSIIEAQEAERKRISRELHDSIGQMLSSVKFRLHDILEKMPRTSNVHRSELAEVQSLLEQTLQEVRRISQNLRPSVLDDLGLVSAVRTLCDELQKRTTMQVDLTLPERSQRFPPDVELALFRIIQEALNNSEKHSNASHLQVSILHRDSTILVSIRDNGKGFDLSHTPGHDGRPQGIGLDSIRERASAIGATVKINPRPGDGSEIELVIPLSINTNETVFQ